MSEPARKFIEEAISPTAKWQNRKRTQPLEPFGEPLKNAWRRHRRRSKPESTVSDGRCHLIVCWPCCSTILNTLWLTFERRATHPLPKTLDVTPSKWERPSQELAKECGLSPELNLVFDRVRKFFEEGLANRTA